MSQTLIEELRKLAEESVDVEVFFPLTWSGRLIFHTDCLSFADYSLDKAIEYISNNELSALDIRYELMDEEMYNRTICANCDSFDFSEVYKNKDAKVLCIILPHRE